MVEQTPSYNTEIKTPSPSDIIKTTDGREISEKDVANLIDAGQSWSSLQFPWLAKALNLPFSVPYCNDPELVGVRPPVEWIKAPGTSCQPAIIYCTWAGFGSDISLKIVEDEVRAFNNLSIHPDVFILDEGWEPKPGDWLSVNREKFPKGLEEATDLIHQANMEAWLWWGPFNVSRDSVLAQEHPSWLATAKNADQPTSFGIEKTSMIPPYFILDPRSRAAWAYLETIAAQIKKWGFDGVKVDFLTNAFFVPGINPQEALLYAHKLLLALKNAGLTVEGCGCPFSAAVGVADYLRVTNDSGLPRGTNPEIARRVNHIMVNGVVRGVRRTTLARRFGVISDPDMFYQFDLDPPDLERLRRVQEISIKHQGCLTLGDNITELTKPQIELIRQLINQFHARHSSQQ